MKYQANVMLAVKNTAEIRKQQSTDVLANKTIVIFDLLYNFCGIRFSFQLDFAKMFYTNMMLTW